MSDCLLDASALLALLNQERGAEQVAARLPAAQISAVNLAEVVGKLSEAGMPEAEVRLTVGALGLQIVAFDAGMAFEAGKLRPLTRKAGLSLGDRACLATARILGQTVLTADRAWAKLNVGVVIECIR